MTTETDSCVCGGSGGADGLIDTNLHSLSCPKHIGYTVKFTVELPESVTVEYKTARDMTQKYYSLYACQDVRDDGSLSQMTVHHFGDSNTILGIRIGGKLLLSEDEAVEQINRWNEHEEGYPAGQYYSLYRPELIEAGMTPPLPGMSDRDIAESSKLRFPAPVGHVVGQGGVCWCGERHADAVPGDPVSLPNENEGMSMAVEAVGVEWDSVPS